MAKKASGGGEDAAAAFKDSIAILRRRKLFFAIAMNGRTPVIQTHIKKKPKTLRKEAKSMGGGPKGCSGEIGISGKIIQLYCVEEAVPDAIAKQTTKWLRENGMQFKVEIMPDQLEEPADEEGDEEAEQSGPAAARRPATQAEEAPSGAASSASSSEERTTGSGRSAASEAEEEADDQLEEAGIDTGASSGAPQASDPEEEEEPIQASAPEGRTREQDQLLSGLRDMKSLLQQVSSRGRTEDVARMQKFGELFKRAVKQNDSQVGHKVLDGMRQLSKQVEERAQEAEKRSSVRVSRLQEMRGGLESLIRELRG